ncbi:MAG TPA: FtsQ-type POTRA domain-containing protein [Gaiellaceae bacterium]|nr:FtsQ-type POTRA domain-containing protein [Gaiellaceae bacterium]
MPARPRFARSVARVEALALPWQLTLPDVQPRAWLARLAPTRRSLLVGFGVLAVALGAYLIARETPLFAIDRVEVHGGSRTVQRQVRQALASLQGAPLVGLDGSAVLQKVDALPTVLRASYDRDFPNTLRITVVPERPASVLRRGADSWLVSARGRVMERLGSSPPTNLPRIWISTRVPVRIGADVTGKGPGTAARALGLAGALGARVAFASYGNGSLVLHLRSGLELLLGDPGDVKLKVAVAKRVLPRLPAGTTFLDLSTPGRPVGGTGSPTISTVQSSSRG